MGLIDYNKKKVDKKWKHKGDLKNCVLIGLILKKQCEVIK